MSLSGSLFVNVLSHCWHSFLPVYASYVEAFKMDGRTRTRLRGTNSVSPAPNYKDAQLDDDHSTRKKKFEMLKNKTGGKWITAHVDPQIAAHTDPKTGRKNGSYKLAYGTVTFDNLFGPEYQHERNRQPEEEKEKEKEKKNQKVFQKRSPGRPKTQTATSLQRSTPGRKLTNPTPYKQSPVSGLDKVNLVTSSSFHCCSEK